MTGSVTRVPFTWLMFTGLLCICEIWSIAFVMISAINFVFVCIGLSFGDTNKRREQPYSIVLLLYPFRPSLTAGVLEVGLNNADSMTDQKQP